MSFGMKTRKNVSVVVEDIVEELIEENKRLLSELKLSKRYVKYLFELKAILDSNCDKLIAIFDREEWIKLTDIWRNINTSIPAIEGSVEGIKSEPSYSTFAEDIFTREDKQDYHDYGHDDGCGNSLQVLSTSSSNISDPEDTSVPLIESSDQEIKFEQGDSTYAEDFDTYEYTPSNDDHGDGQVVAKPLQELQIYHPFVNNIEEEVPKNVIDFTHEEEYDGGFIELEDTPIETIDQGDIKPESDSPRIQCTECYRSFATNQLYGSHNVNDRTCGHTCELCGKNFTSEVAINRHVKNVHSPKQFRCTKPGCEYSTTRKCNLKLHMVVHSDDRPHVCPVHGCGKAFKVLFKLRQHQRRHSDMKPTLRGVNGSGKVCKTRDCHAAHQGQIHHIGKEMTSDWPRSDITTWTHYNLRSHKLFRKDLTFKCNHQGCDKVFRKKDSFLQHQVHHQPSASRYSCEWPGCHFWSHHKTSVTQHKLIHSKPYVCQWPGCQYKTARKYRLRQHESKAVHHLPSGAFSAPMDQIMADNVVAKVEFQSG